MNIQPFIFSWNRQFDKVCQTEKDLLSIFDKVIVINSNEKNTKDTWINLGDSAYFMDMFRKALEIFDGDILMHVQGDVSYDNWNTLIKDALYYINYYNAGIYAPYVDYTAWNNCDLNIEPYHKNIKLVCCTDSLVWFIKKEILIKIIEGGIDFSKNKLGWGWDVLLCAMCYYENIPVIRDYNHIVNHPKVTNYNKIKAKKEEKQIYDQLNLGLKIIVEIINNKNSEKLKKYINPIFIESFNNKIYD